MTRRKRGSSQESPSAPKSPRLRRDAKIDSAAAARGSSPATDGPHNGAASTQVHHSPQPPSIPTQREVRGPAATASVAHRRAACAAPRPPPPSSALTTVRGPLNPRQQAAAAEALSSSAALNCTPPSLQDGYCSGSTPPPARAPTPSPSSPHMSWNSIRSSGMPYSFADAVKRGANQSPDDRRRGNQSPDDNLVQRFCDYLKNMPNKTANNSSKGQIITVTQTEISDLKIVEQDLDEHDSELAYAVFNSQGRFEELLYPAVSQFLISKGIVNNAVGGMNASFYTMPPSTKALEDFIREQGSLVSIKSIFDGNFELCVASDIGMVLVHGFLVYILDIHKHGRTWNGEFGTGDMVVENCFKCRITNKISVKGKSDCRAADLRKIAEIFKPMFTINEKMALYFDVLQKDLWEAKIEEVEAKWYREYLLSHPALKSSIARYNLECGLHAALKSSIARYNVECGLHRSGDTTKSNDKPIPSVLLEGSDWMPIIPQEITKHTPCTDYSLFKVFWHKHDPTKHLHPYERTVRGLLTYKRNFLQHGHEHIKVQDHTELEQFAAKTFHEALPNVLRGLLSRCEMNGPFKDHWEAYRSSRVGNDGNTERRTGIRISFCEDVSGGGQV